MGDMDVLCDAVALEAAVVQHVKETGHTDIRCQDDPMTMLWGVECACGKGWGIPQLPLASMWDVAEDTEADLLVLRDHYLKASARRARLASLVEKTLREGRPVLNAWSRLLDDD